MFVEVPVDRGLDGAWGDVVYGDAVRGQLDGDSPHQHPDAPFGRAVGGVGRHWQSSCTEETLMMRPPSPWEIICLAASWHPSHTPVRLTEITFSHTSRGVSRKGIFCSMPALLTMTSR